MTCVTAVLCPNTDLGFEELYAKLKTSDQNGYAQQCQLHYYIIEHNLQQCHGLLALKQLWQILFRIQQTNASYGGEVRREKTLQNQARNQLWSPVFFRWNI